MSNKITNAVMITGAAARISQEVACIDILMQTKGLAINQDNTLLTGFSSGSLNLLALNSCFRNENPISWEKDYKEGTLWPLKNEDVYTPNGIHIPLFDTAPLRKTIETFMAKGGFVNYSDMPFSNYILTFSQRKLKTEWAANFGANNQADFVGVDLFMCSTAIPIAFPPQHIVVKEGGVRNFPEGKFRDGGTGGQFKHFEDHIGQYVKDNGAFETLHIISPMREVSESDLTTLSEGRDGHTLGQLEKAELDKFAASISFGAFIKFCKALQSWQNENGPIAKEVMVTIPRMDKNFGILDFNNEKLQYDTTYQWLKDNPNEVAVPLNNFIAQHG